MARRPSNKRRRNRPGISGESVNQHNCYRDRGYQRDQQGAQVQARSSHRILHLPSSQEPIEQRDLDAREKEN